jgi:hypothetical protein
MSTPKTTLNLNPKVFVSILTGIGLAIVGGVTAKLDPTFFAGLGAYAVPASAVATAALSGVAGWLKSADAKEGNGEADEVAEAVKTAVADVVKPTTPVATVVADAEKVVAVAGEPVAPAGDLIPTLDPAPVAAPVETAGTSSSVIG